MSTIIEKCPLCPTGCRLVVPRCGRGQEYARLKRMGQIPDQWVPETKPALPKRLQFEKKEEQMVMKYLHHAVGVADRGEIKQEQAKDMFSVLTAEETKMLAEMLERLSEHWIGMANSGKVGD